MHIWPDSVDGSRIHYYRASGPQGANNNNFDIINCWSKEWIVSINKTKTAVTCYSLSTKQEKVKLSTVGDEIPQVDNPTCPGVKRGNKKSTGDIEIKAIKKMAVMKKLGGTRWGANSTILTQVYTGSVRPHMEYASNSWSTAAKTNTARLKKVQNTGLRLITGVLKTTHIAALEKNTGLHSSEWGRDEKLLRQTKKMKRLPSHPLHSKLQELTKNRLKRQSVNHFAKGLQRSGPDLAFVVRGTL